jgi:hypothetical protein
VSIKRGLALAVMLAIAVGLVVGLPSLFVSKVAGPLQVATGPSVEETRAVGTFDRIAVEDSIDVQVNVTDAPSGEVRLRGSEAMLADLVTEIVDGVLVVKYKTDKPRFGSPDVFVETKSLVSLDLAGSGDASVVGLRGPSFAAAVAGSGTIAASGTVDKLTIAIDGSGDVEADDLNAKEAVVTLSGSGQIDLGEIAKTLQATVSGSGDVNYGGEPTVTMSVSGSGSVDRR